jgi:hypothetical protein
MNKKKIIKKAVKTIAPGAAAIAKDILRRKPKKPVAPPSQFAIDEAKAKKPKRSW